MPPSLLRRGRSSRIDQEPSLTIRSVAGSCAASLHERGYDRVQGRGGLGRRRWGVGAWGFGAGGALVDLGGRLVETGWQAGRGHGGGDFLHLANPAPALGGGGGGGPLGLLSQRLLGHGPLAEQGPLDAAGPGERAGGKQQR